MAVTAAQAVTNLVTLLNASPLKTGEAKISGFIYPYQRPLNSEKEDIVVNSITVGRGPVQKGMLNVNVYVPNKAKPVSYNAVDTSQPDMPRLLVLNQMAGEVLRDIWNATGTVNYELQEDRLMADANDQHYINFRVIFRALNI